MPEGTARVAPGKGRSSKVAAAAMFDVLSEILPVYARIKALGTKAWTGMGPHPGVRFSFLRLLKVEGPMTVPQIARSRGVARQHIQTLANRMAEEGLIEFVPNPEHRRSKLLRLTPEGLDALASGERDVKQIAKELSADMNADELAIAARVLAELYGRLGDKLDQM